jgi:Tol biopolymer transport system component
MMSNQRSLGLVLLGWAPLVCLACTGNTSLGYEPNQDGSAGKPEAGQASPATPAGDAGPGQTTGQTTDGGALPGSGGPSAVLPVCGSGLGTDNTPGSIFFDSDLANFNRDIYVVRPDGSGLTRVTSAASIEKEPAVAPDGSRIGFTSDRDGTLQIYLMDLTTKAIVKLTNMPAGADQSRFSRDGHLVTFHSGASVYVIRPDGTGQVLVASGLDSFNAYFWPDFSADGQELVFDRNNEINATRLDGTGLRRVVNNWTTTIKSPRVSPGGAELAYSAYCGTGLSISGLSIWTTPFSTGTNPCEGRRLSPVDEPDSQRPAWGPNDVFAYERVNKATNVASIVLLARTPGSLPCTLTPNAADSRNPSWSP